MKWIIKKKLSSGQKPERVWDTKKNKWREQRSAIDGSFEAEPDDARALRDKLLQNARGFEWLRLQMFVEQA